MGRLVLDTNCFVFEGQYYRQIRGGAMGSPFTLTLANIYMLKWDQLLVEHQRSHNELYGRHVPKTSTLYFKKQLGPQFVFL